MMNLSFRNVQFPVLLLLLGSACTSGKTDSDELEDSPKLPTVPTVLITSPLEGGEDVPLNSSVSATFSEEMDATTLTGATYTLSTGEPPVLVSATVVYADSTAVLWPSAHLLATTRYTATVTTGAQSALGEPLAADYVWSFKTGEGLAPGLPVDLGTAGNFVILGKSGVATVPTSAVTGDIGLSPAAATFLTGFSLSLDATNVFASSSQVTGRLFAADFSPPTPSNLTTAIGDMELAFTDASGRAPDYTELGAGNVGGMTLAPGVYKWGTGLLIPTDVTLSGTATDVWIFQVAQDLTLSSATQVILSGGALPENVFWQVAGSVNIGSTAHMEGVVLTKTAITLLTGSSINGRLLAQTAVALDGSTVVAPAE